MMQHTFITGSTGSGKSNTIYQLLDKLCLEKGSGTHFLVIEPAKGEYKDMLGGNVDAYGTNKAFSPLLKINPFEFKSPIHVNVCWPMYAAMPAVLKEAVETAYENAGRDLSESTNPYDNVFFPLLPMFVSQFKRSSTRRNTPMKTRATTKEPS